MTLLSPKPTTNASGLGGPSPHEPTFLNAMLVVHTPTPPTITQSQPPTPIAMTDSLFGLSKLCEAKITFGTQDDEEARDMFTRDTPICQRTLALVLGICFCKGHGGADSTPLQACRSSDWL